MWIMSKNIKPQPAMRSAASSGGLALADKIKLFSNNVVGVGETSAAIAGHQTKSGKILPNNISNNHIKKRTDGKSNANNNESNSNRSSITSTTLQQTLPPPDDETILNLVSENSVITFDDDDDDHEKVDEKLSINSPTLSFTMMTLPKKEEHKFMLYDLSQDKNHMDRFEFNCNQGSPIKQSIINETIVPVNCTNNKTSPAKYLNKTAEDILDYNSSSTSKKKYSSCWKSEELLTLEPVASIENIYDDANFEDEFFDCSTMSRIEPSPEKLIDEMIRIRQSLELRNNNDDIYSIDNNNYLRNQVDARLSGLIPLAKNEDEGDDVIRKVSKNKSIRSNKSVEYANVFNGRCIGNDESLNYVNLGLANANKTSDYEKLKKMNAFFGESKDSATELETQIFTSLISGRDIKQPVCRQPSRQQQKGRRSLNQQKNLSENTTGAALLKYDLARVKKWAINGMEGGMAKLKNLNKSIENLSISKTTIDWSSWKHKLMKVIKGPQGHSKSSFVVDTFGVPIHMCPMSSARYHQHIPALVEFCVGVVESLGISNKGIYRIPGNNAGVNELLAELNKDPDLINFENDRWMDVNVVGSLLKLFFRKLPDPLLPSAFYNRVINISKCLDLEKKLLKLKSILFELPTTNWETFKFLANHLHKIADNQEENKMNAHNLAIMFGPSLVHPLEESTNQMIADMNMQTHIVELIIIHSDWLFSDWSVDTKLSVHEGCSTPESINNPNNNNLQLLPNAEAILAMKSKELDMENMNVEGSPPLSFLRHGFLRLSNRSTKSKNKLTKVDSSSSAGESANPTLDEEKEVVLRKLECLSRSYHIWRDKQVVDSYQAVNKNAVIYSGSCDSGASNSSTTSSNSSNLKRNLTKKYASNELQISSPITASHPTLLSKQTSEKFDINRNDSFSSITRYPAYSFKNSTITSRNAGAGRRNLTEKNSKVSSSSSSSLGLNVKDGNNSNTRNNNNDFGEIHGNVSLATTNSDPFLTKWNSPETESETRDVMVGWQGKRKESFVVKNPQGRRYFVPSSTDSLSLFLHSPSHSLSRSQLRDSIVHSSLQINNRNNNYDGYDDDDDYNAMARTLPTPNLCLKSKSNLEIPLCKYTVTRKRAY